MGTKWNVSPAEAIRIQAKLRAAVVLEPLPRPIKTIAGADVSLNRFSDILYAGIIVLSYPDLRLLDQATVKIKTTMPYIPGLLSFREIPGLLKCWKKLTIKPDLVIVDGQGIAHPRRLGIATHFGLLTGSPTIGCAKNVLYGRPAKRAGHTTPLIDPKTNEVIGFLLESKARSKPLVISPGHQITLSESLDIVTTCLRGYRLPEPTRLAHNLVNDFRRGMIGR